MAGPALAPWRIPGRHAHVRFGSKADIALRLLMSALPPKADIRRRNRHVRFVPIPDIQVDSEIRAGRKLATLSLS